METMPSRYVPPALRHRQENAGLPQGEGTPGIPQSDNDLPTRKLEHLQVDESKHMSGSSRGLEPDLLAIEDIHIHFAGLDYLVGSRSTLNDSILPAGPGLGKLAYIMLFKDANPRWEQDRIIFAKTNISFLPGFEQASNGVLKQRDESSGQCKDGKNSTLQGHAEDQTCGSYDVDVPIDASPIPAFVEQPRKQTFLLAGWFRLEKISFLRPRSPELARMLAQKWDLRDKRGRTRNVRRDKEAWGRSLSVPWAVIKMTKVERGEGGRELQIKRHGNPKDLREQRLRDKYGDLSSEKAQESEANTGAAANEDLAVVSIHEEVFTKDSEKDDQEAAGSRGFP